MYSFLANMSSKNSRMKSSHSERVLHIAFLNRVYYPDTSATSQLLTELCESLVRDYGYRVSVIAAATVQPGSVAANPSRRRRLFDVEKHSDVAIYRTRNTSFAKKKFVGRALNYVSYFLAACWACLCLDEPDIVVALTDPPIIGLAA